MSSWVPTMFERLIGKRWRLSVWAVDSADGTFWIGAVWKAGRGNSLSDHKTYRSAKVARIAQMKLYRKHKNGGAQ